MSYTTTDEWQSEAHHLEFRVNNLRGSPEVALDARDEAICDFVASASGEEIRAFLTYALEAAKEIDRVASLVIRLSNHDIRRLARHGDSSVLDEISQEARALLKSPYADQADKELFQSALNAIEGHS
jgi:hypothetical protein